VSKRRAEKGLTLEVAGLLADSQGFFQRVAKRLQLWNQLYRLEPAEQVDVQEKEFLLELLACLPLIEDLGEEAQLQSGAVLQALDENLEIRWIKYLDKVFDL